MVLKNDKVDSLFSFINSDVSNDNIKLIMTFMIVLSILALLFFLIESDIITGKFVIFFIVITVFMYMYYNRTYKDRMNNLKKQVNINTVSDVLTNFCTNTPDSSICKSFYELQNTYNNSLKSISEDNKDIF